MGQIKNDITEKGRERGVTENYTIRSSPTKVFYKKCVHKNFKKFEEKLL